MDQTSTGINTMKKQAFVCQELIYSFSSPRPIPVIV